jgi:phage shock protein E
MPIWPASPPAINPRHPRGDTLRGMQQSRILTAGAAVLAAVSMGLAGCSNSTSLETTASAAGQGPAAAPAKPESPVRVGVAEFASIVNAPGVTVLDVRTPEEFTAGHIEGAINIPVEYPDYLDRVGQLDPNGTYAVYCRSGNRSQPAVAGLASLGINGVFELESGTIGWTAEGQPLVQ